MKRIIYTDNAPAPIGPYSQAIIAEGSLLFTAGQIALDAESGEIIGGDIAQQTEKVIENLKAILEAGGSSLSKVIKTTVYLKDMNDFPAMNEVYNNFFETSAPARSTVEVARLPKDVLVEIDCIALV